MVEKVARQQGLVEFRHLRHLVAVAEHGSFRKAGAALGLSQSAISRCIAQLEDEIGASLFHRHPSGVSLTFAGKHFLSVARKTIRIVGEGKNEVGAVGRGEIGCVRIGIYCSIASGFLTDLLQHYSDKHNDVRIELLHGSADEHVVSVRKLRLDVAFLPMPLNKPDCECSPLWSERLFVALPARHPLTFNDTLDWKALVDETFVVSQAAAGVEIDTYLSQEILGTGKRPIIQVQAVGLDNILALVAMSRGVTLVCEAMTAALYPGITYRPILGEVLPISAVWSARNDNPAFRRLLSLAKTMAVRPASPAQNAGP